MSDLKSQLSQIKILQNNIRDFIINRASQVPSEFFEFICDIDQSFNSLIIFKIIDSDLHLLVRYGTKPFVICDFMGINPCGLSAYHVYELVLRSPKVPLEEALNEIPRGAGVFLCFHLDEIA